jgi:hypothetical protein
MPGKQSDYQRRYYEENRERRLAESSEYQRQHREERREYMRQYHLANKSKFRRTPDQRERYNAARRERYAADAGLRERTRAKVKSWQAKNPSKRLAQRLRAHGLTVAEYKQILAEQGGGCAICGRTDSGDKRGHRLHVDHCHSTGRFRGLLCTRCNKGLGHFGDDPERLERAAMYLRVCVGEKGSDQ